MIDSGATCNFMSQALFRTLKLDFVQLHEHQVKLADGAVLKTCGQVVCDIDFGTVRYSGTFHVLPGSVPLILGMAFLAEMQPEIDWVSRKVCVAGRQLKVVDFVQRPAIQTVETPVNNSFEGLQVSECTVVAQEDIVAAPAKFKSVAKRVRFVAKCHQCGKKHVGDGVACSRCRNASFSHLASDQLVSESHSAVDPVVKSTVLEPSVEVVPLSVFTRAGKRGHYEQCGLITLFPVDDVSKEVSDVNLNFTHRTSHGAADDADAKTGKYDKLAADALQRLKASFPEVFREPVYPVDRSDCPQQFEHEIRLVDESAPPPKRKIYPLDNVELEELKKQIAEFLESNRIKPSNSPYGSPILFAKKKGGSLRMCIDYRMLNQQSVNDSFPLPRIDELLQRLDGSTIFSKLDLRDGYHQIPMKASDSQKTAFSCRYGTFEFTVMPFGLSTAPGTFQRMMNNVFFDLLDAGVVCYLDDLLLYSKSVAEHQALLTKVFAILSKNKLYLKDSKCHLFLEKVNFLGHVVSADGVAMEAGKVQAVQDWPVPTSMNQVQQFLGLANYYRKFILRFSEIAGPLSLLTRKGQPFIWEAAQQQAFETLKAVMCSAPVLRLFDKSLQTRVVCDASNYCVGAVLEQQDVATQKWHPVEFFSKRLSISERNYSATDREFVAIRLSLTRWRHFFIGVKFLILTDHAALTYLQSSQGVNRRNARWLDFLSQFQFDIAHIKGKENVVADSLSRIPGAELLTQTELLSHISTLNMLHVQDLPLRMCADAAPEVVCSSMFLQGIISVNERSSFRAQLLAEQQAASSNVWFQQLVQQAQGGSAVYQLRNGLLCKLVKDHFCPVIPVSDSSTIEVVLSDLHSSALGGHLGRRKLLAEVQKRFYWQNMYRSVDSFLKRCAVCQQNKSSTQKPRGLLQPLENAKKCFQHVSMDFVMNLPVSVRGYDAIFSIVDRFSRLVRFVPCKSDLTAQDAAQLFFEHWVCRFGMPTKIISDRDPRFTSAFWQSLCKALSCRVALSSGYHPQTDGLTERFHRSVEQVLRCYCSAEQASWCVLLSQCEFALNNSVQDSHNVVPNEVVFGFKPAVPLDTAMPLDSAHAQNVVSHRFQVHSQVATAQDESSRRMAASADSHRCPADLAVGMKVWLATGHLPVRSGARKLAEKWTGPFTITAQVTKEAWKLALPSQWKLHPVFHSSQLKPVVGEPRAVPPVLLEESPEAEYEVARVLKERTVRGQKQYLVRWKGYSSYDDTWEPVANLKNAQRCLDEFLKARKA